MTILDILKSLDIISAIIVGTESIPQFPSAIGWREKSASYNHKTTIWVSHDYYLNPEFHKILSKAF